MTYGISITVDDVIDALAAFIKPFIPGERVVRAQVNRVPQPESPCVVLTELLSVDISWPTLSNNAISQITTITGPTRIDVQADLYGPEAGDYCRAFKTAFFSAFAYDAMPGTIKPLYCSDGIQAPLITGEQQYESRWTVTASIQYNPATTVTQQSAVEAEAVIEVPVDLT